MVARKQQGDGMQISLTSGALWAMTVVFSIASSLVLPTLSPGEQADALYPFPVSTLSARSPNRTPHQSRRVRYAPVSSVHCVQSAALAPTRAIAL
jgi:hypothetical protein